MKVTGRRPEGGQKKMEAGSGTPDESRERINNLTRQIKQTREKIELETRTFIEAARNFTSEWIRREVERTEVSKNEIEYKKENLGEKKHREEKPKQEISGEQEPDPVEQIARIPSIVEESLNCDEYWIHRNELFHPGIASDYLEFKKEKTRKQLTTCIRMLLGCAAELLSDRGYARSEGKVWVRERERRKYVCILRFSEEMEASLTRYFSMLEELYSLYYELGFYEPKFRT
ncbi:hypothetical protein [Methanosarcina sp. MTP4]|uniref:hypothetical protein n=1 Tax=Methanosarcina sp. MTP4 TaxID=1434100 RepID=UPI001E617B7D|nr:hypothetical protein [Methanosarcina sp. MTP4]